MGERIPLELPNSWYVIGYADEIRSDRPKHLRFLERDFVAFRDESGTPVVLDAHCPHLGANLAVGGSVAGGSIRCPFHGWLFDASGQCTEIPYCKRIPAGARVRSFRAIDHCGMVLIWYHAEDSEPQFEIPQLPEWNDPDFSHSWVRSEFTIKTHPQEMAENGSDWAHFPFIHKMTFPSEIQYRFEGAANYWSIEVGKEFSTREGFHDDFELSGETWGLGYTVVRQAGKFRTAIVTGLTPIDRETTCVKLGVIAKQPDAMSEETAAELQAYIEEHAVVPQQDVPIWENKVYRESPLLCEADGPIAEYRRWAQQFY
ncbi:MAG: hypothetical protein CL908_23020 [Deltaproteobacteria bacterium]|nr:hypothetical protein [Deltaproteobacteria bacterium]